MDRDIALQITQKITAINTALQALVTNTTPAVSASLSMSRSENNDEPVEPEPVEPESVEPESVDPEPVTRKKK